MKSVKSLLLALFLVGIVGLSACTSATVQSGQRGLSKTDPAMLEKEPDKGPPDQG